MPELIKLIIVYNHLQTTISAQIPVCKFRGSQFCINILLKGKP